MKKVATYKGYIIAYCKELNNYQVFSKDEWSCGEGCRYPEFDDCETIEIAKECID